jgi:hypothetical protein
MRTRRGPVQRQIAAHAELADVLLAEFGDQHAAIAAQAELAGQRPACLWSSSSSAASTPRSPLSTSRAEGCEAARICSQQSALAAVGAGR